MKKPHESVPTMTWQLKSARIGLPCKMYRRGDQATDNHFDELALASPRTPQPTYRTRAILRPTARNRPIASTPRTRRFYARAVAQRFGSRFREEEGRYPQRSVQDFLRKLVEVEWLPISQLRRPPSGTDPTRLLGAAARTLQRALGESGARRGALGGEDRAVPKRRGNDTVYMCNR